MEISDWHHGRVRWGGSQLNTSKAAAPRNADAQATPHTRASITTEEEQEDVVPSPPGGVAGRSGGEGGADMGASEHGVEVAI